MYLGLVDALTAGTLVENTETNSLPLGNRDERGGSLRNDEHIALTGGKLVTDRVLDVDDLIGSLVLLTMLNNTNATSVTSTSDHGQVSSIELDEVDNLNKQYEQMSGSEMKYTMPYLVGLQVHLDRIEHFNQGIRVANGAAIVCGDVRDTSGTNTDRSDLWIVNL